MFNCTRYIILNIPRCIVKNRFFTLLIVNFLDGKYLYDRVIQDDDFELLETYATFKQVDKLFVERIALDCLQLGKINLYKNIWEKKSEKYHINCPSDFLPTGTLAEYGHLNIIEYLFEKHPNRNIENIFTISLSHGHLHICKWLYEKDYIYFDKGDVFAKPINSNNEARKISTCNDVCYFLFNC